MNNSFFRWAVLTLLVGILVLNLTSVVVTTESNRRLKKILWEVMDSNETTSNYLYEILIKAK